MRESRDEEMFTIITKFIRNLFFWVLSHCPLCTFSNDGNYGTIQWEDFKNKEKRKFRLSLFSIGLGDSIWYFITYEIDNKKLSLCYRLRLETCPGQSLDDEAIKCKIKRYSGHLQLLSEDEMMIEKESLINRLRYEENRISSSMSRINIYTSILLAFLTIVVPIMLAKYTVYCVNWYDKIVFVLLCFTVFNLSMIVFSGMKVRAYKRSSFSDLKNSWEKSLEVLIQYYYDWQQTLYKANFFVSLVKNIEEWIICFVIIVILSYIPMCKDDFKVPTKDMDEHNMVCTISIKDIDEPYSVSAIELAKLILDIETQRKSKLILIAKNIENANKLVNRLNKYDKITNRILIDKHIEDGILKVFWEEE